MSTVLLCLLAVLTLGFVAHAAARPWGALMGDAEAMGRLFHAGAPLSNIAIFAHMATGALITVAVPLQLIPMLRLRAPRIHRASGYVLVSASLLTAMGGLVYIATQGTIGGAWMSGWFAVYGGLMALAAAQVVRHARARRFDAHRDWALRLLVLAVASFLYRVHYGLNFAMFEGWGVESDFTGPFDRANVWAFFIPYLILLEAILTLVRRRAFVLASKGAKA